MRSLGALSTKASLVWDNVYGFDFTPLKDTALSEPLVDTVEMKACVTDPHLVYTIDLYTIKKEDLAFRVPFNMSCQRDDFIHAIVAWFDMEFGACHKPIKFSTGPHAKYTHWKQTVFYLREVLKVQQDESLSGFLTCKPNEKKPRDLDINISYQLESVDHSRATAGELEFKM